MELKNFTISELDLIMESLYLKEDKLNIDIQKFESEPTLFYKPSIINELSVLQVIRKKIFQFIISHE